MKTAGVVAIAAALGGAYYLTQVGTAGATAQFVFESVQFSSLTKWNVMILVQNVSNARINLNALAADITLNGDDIGNASFFPPTPAQIEPTSQQVVNLEVDLSILSLPGAIQDLISNPGSSYNFEVTGTANVNGFLVPFTLKKTITA